MVQHISIDADITPFRSSGAFPTYFSSSRRCTPKLAHCPGLDSRIQPGIIEVLEIIRGLAPVLFVIVADFDYEGPGIGVIEHHLTGACRLQSLSIQLLDCGKIFSGIHSIEVVEKFERSFLVFRGILVIVITLMHGDMVRMTKLVIKFGNLPHRLVCAFYGEEVEYGSSHEHRAWIHHEQ